MFQSGLEWTASRPFFTKNTLSFDVVRLRLPEVLGWGVRGSALTGKGQEVTSGGGVCQPFRTYALTGINTKSES